MGTLLLSRGGVGRSIWYGVDLVDVFMKGLGPGVDQPIARLGLVCWSVDWQSCHMSEYGIATSDNPVRQVRDQCVKRPQSYGQNHAT